jgi:hypothetical protein
MKNFGEVQHTNPAGHTYVKYGQEKVLCFVNKLPSGRGEVTIPGGRKIRKKFSPATVLYTLDEKMKMEGRPIPLPQPAKKAAPLTRTAVVPADPIVQARQFFSM